MPDNPEPKDKELPRRPQHLKQLAWLEESLVTIPPVILGKQIVQGQFPLPLANDPDALYGVAPGSYLPPGLSLEKPNYLVGVPTTLGHFRFTWCAFVEVESPCLQPLTLSKTIGFDIVEGRPDGGEKKTMEKIVSGIYRNTYHLSPDAIVRLHSILRGPEYHVIRDAELLALQQALADAVMESEEVSVSVSISTINRG